MTTQLRIVHLVRKFRLGLFVLILLAAPAAWGGEVVKVTLINGDTFVAQKDDRSDQRRLWLRFAGESEHALRFVFWGDVSAVEKVDVKPAAKSQISQNVHTVATKLGRSK